nr:MAG: alkaline shock response membrane anchor protein AmaP [Bacillota bacterium]
MRFFERVIVFFICLATALSSTIVLLFSLKVFSLDLIWTRLVYFYGSSATAAIAGIFLLGSIFILISGARVRRTPESIINSGEMGNVSISFSALENLVLKAANGVERLKDVKVQLKLRDNSLSINLKVTVASDTNIPELSAELQKVVKDYVESMAGISVQEVAVKVENIAVDQKLKSSRG